MTNELPFILEKGMAIDYYKMESVEELLNSLMHLSNWAGDACIPSIYSYMPKVSADSCSLIAMFCLET